MTQIDVGGHSSVTRGDADDTFLPGPQHSEDTAGRYSCFRSWALGSNVMSSITISRLSKRWQRGLAIEGTLIVLLVAFSAFQFLSVL